MSGKISIKEMLSLNKYGNTSEIIPYFQFLTDQKFTHGAIMLCNGSFMIVYRYRGKDLASLNNYELNNIQNRVSQALKMLDEGWSIQTDLVRVKVDSYIKESDNDFGDMFTAELLDEEGRAAFSQDNDNIESRFYLTLTWLPPNSYINKIDGTLYSTGDEDKNVEKATKEFVRQKQVFWDGLARISDMLSISFNELEVLDRSETLSFLDKCWNDDGQKFKLINSFAQPFLNKLIGKKDIQTELFPKIGKKYCGCVAIYDLPNAVYPGIIDFLNTVNLELRFNCRFVCSDTLKAEKFLKNTIQKWKSKRLSIWARIAEMVHIEMESGKSEFAEQMVVEASSQLRLIESGEVKHGFYNCTIVLFDEDLKSLNRKLSFLETQLTSLEFIAKVEDINTMDSYVGSQPGCTFENLIQLPIFTNQLSCLIPITSYWAGDKESSKTYKTTTGKNPVLGYMKTDNNSPFRFTHHYGDVGHMMVIGQAGAGKSVFLNYLVSQHMRYKDSFVFFFDKMASSRILNYALNGRFYDILPIDENGLESLDLSMTFQPLKKINTPSDRAWAENWLSDIVRLYGVEPTPRQLNRIKDALSEMVTKSSRTMSDFLTFLQDESLKEIFENYTTSEKTGIGKIFDGKNQSLELNRFTVFEMDGLFRINNKKYIYPLIKYLFKLIIDKVKIGNNPSLIILDEAWKFLDTPVFENEIQEWLRELRKYNCSVVFATQNLAETFESNINKTILQECHTKVMLPNENVANPVIRNYYVSMGFNDNEIENMIRRATPKKHYYIAKGNDRRLVDLALDLRPLLFALITGSGADSAKLAKEMKLKYGDDFVFYWWKRYAEKTNLDLSFWLNEWKKKKVIFSNKKFE